MAVVKNLVIDKYSNYEKIFILYDKNKNPFNLTNYTANSQIRKITDQSVIASFTCSIQSPKTEGKILMRLSYSATANAIPGLYSYDVLLSSTTDPTEKIRAVQGEVEITPNITE